MNKFRVHHILCTVLYEGKGYSGAFCENMTKIVEILQENQNETVVLATSTDMICKNCPNLTMSNTCRQDQNHVEKKDLLLKEELHLEEGKKYSYRELLHAAEIFMTQEAFDKSCSNCKWYLQGICSYEKFKKNLDRLLQDESF